MERDSSDYQLGKKVDVVSDSGMGIFKGSRRTVVRRDWFLAGLVVSLIIMGLTLFLSGLLVVGFGIRPPEGEVEKNAFVETVSDVEEPVIEWQREGLVVTVLNGSSIGGRAMAASEVLKEVGYQIGLVDKAVRVEVTQLLTSGDVASISGLVAADMSELLGHEVVVGDDVLDGNNQLQLIVSE